MSPGTLSSKISSAVTRSANRVLDRALGVGATEVLNSGSAQPSLADPAAVLRRLANQMRATAVDERSGRVDYPALADSEVYTRFRSFTRALPTCKLDELGGRAEGIAFWINLYNALILHGVIHYRVTDSVLSDLGFFRRAAYDVGGMRFSADDIEHGVLRGNARHPYLPFRQFAQDDPRQVAVINNPDARMHFALVCGARSCPPIAAYDADRLDAQLDQATATFIGGGGARYDADRNLLRISRIFRWYEGDFGGREAVLRLVENHFDGDHRLGQARVRYMQYDWSLNGELPTAWDSC